MQHHQPCSAGFAVLPSLCFWIAATELQSHPRCSAMRLGRLVCQPPAAQGCQGSNLACGNFVQHKRVTSTVQQQTTSPEAHQLLSQRAMQQVILHIGLVECGLKASVRDSSW